MTVNVKWQHWDFLPHTCIYDKCDYIIFMLLYFKLSKWMCLHLLMNVLMLFLWSWIAYIISLFSSTDCTGTWSKWLNSRTRYLTDAPWGFTQHMAEVENHVIPYGYNLSVVFPSTGSGLSNVGWMLHVDDILVWSEIKWAAGVQAF